MGFTRDALDGLAALLAAASVGTYRETGAYAEGETGIIIGLVPQSPDRVICLIPYPLTDDPTLSNSVLGLQVRCRAAGRDVRDAFDLADAVFDQLHALGDVDLAPGIRLHIAERRSGIPLGEDSNGRAEWSDNYELTLDRPSVHRI